MIYDTYMINIWYMIYMIMILQSRSRIRSWCWSALPAPSPPPSCLRLSGQNCPKHLRWVLFDKIVSNKAFIWLLFALTGNCSWTGKKKIVSYYVQYTINIASYSSIYSLKKYFSFHQDANQFGRTDKYFSLKPNRGWGQTFSFISHLLFPGKMGMGPKIFTHKSMFFSMRRKIWNQIWYGIFCSVPNLYFDRWVSPVKGEQD